MNIAFNKYHFAPIYIPLLHTNSPVTVMYGSRGSGKTAFACQKMVIKCLKESYFKCLMTRKHKESVNKSVYDTVKKTIERMGLTSLFKFSDNLSKITCYNGNTFIAMGMYESGGVSGPSKSVTDPTDAIVDELDEATEDEFEKLFFSLRGSETSECIVIFNTHKVDEEHWIFQRWFPPRETFEKLDGSHTYIKSTRPSTIILHTTYLMNPFCTQRYIENFAEQKIFAPERYEISGLGLIKVIKQSNVALKAFDRMIHVKDSIEFNPDVLLYEAWDFNRLPHHTVSLWQFGGYIEHSNEYIWNLVKEFCLPDHSVKETQKEINKYIKSKEYESKKVAIVCDYSGNTKRDHGTQSDINKIKSTLRADGFNVDDRTIVNPSVTASLDFVNDCFDSQVKISSMHPKYGGASIKIQIDSSCKFHIADFEKTKTDKDGKILKITKKDKFIEEGQTVSRSYQARGHGVDNTRYIMTSIFSHEYEVHKSSNGY